MPSSLGSSQTPLRNSFTPSGAFPYSQTPLHSRESSIFANRSLTEPEQPVEIQVAALSERLRHQEEKIAANDQRNKTRDAQIQALAEELAIFRGDLDDLRVAAVDLQEQLQSKLSGGLDQTSFDSNLKYMCTLTNNLFSFSSELERLRTENEALKAKLGGIASPSRTSIPESGSPNALGKRKRDSDVARSHHPQPNGIHTNRPTAIYHNQASSRPILTPQSSIISAHGSQASEQEYTGTALDEAALGIGFNGGLTYDEDEGNMIDFGSRDINGPLLSNQKSTTHEPDEAPLPAENDPAVEDRSTAAQGPQLSENTAISHAGYIEFSDDEFTDKPAGPSGPGARVSADANGLTEETQCSEMTANDFNTENGFEDGEDSVTFNAESETVFKRPQRTTRSNSRRLNDYELEHNVRSLAPEPVNRRRTLPRKLDIGGMDNVQIVTPISLADEMNGVKKLRPERVMQSTEKLLNIELTELGLEHWIGFKDKATNPEYKKAVDEARVRQRERKRLETFAKVGITLAPNSEQAVQSNVSEDPEKTQIPSPSVDYKERQQPSPNVDDILDGGVRDSAKSSGAASAQSRQVPKSGETVPQKEHTTTQTPPVAKNKRARKSDTVETTAEEEDLGMMTRRKQRRQEEIRRRDQLAQEALERDF